MEEDEKAAFLGSTTKTTTMADGSLRVQIDLKPVDAIPAFTAFGAPGSPVALARVSNAAAVEADRPKDSQKPWGQEARALYQSSFFRNPEVWAAVGTDADYLQWVKTQPSAKSGKFDMKDWATGEEFCVAAHVRRVEHGSGTGLKPPYSAIPLTDFEHKESHQHGDSAIGDEDWWQKQRIDHLQRWCWVTVKAQIQREVPSIDCDSWGCIPPVVVESWAIRHNVHNFLPGVYKGHVSAASEEQCEA